MVKPKSEKSVRNRKAVIAVVIIVTVLVVWLGAIATLTLIPKNPNKASDNYIISQYKPPISRAMVEEQALADVEFVIEALDEWYRDRGESLSTQDMKTLKQFYIDQTLKTVGDYYNLE